MDRATLCLLPVLAALIVAHGLRRWSEPTAPAATEASRRPITSSPTVPAPPAARYPWLDAAPGDHLTRFDPPAGFRRVQVEPGSFAEWLRWLPLLPGRGVVHLHDGRRKANQAAHAAIVDIDVGARDLQQCADAVIRLRAEYLLASEREDAIAFDFTSGDRAPWSRWRAGERVRVDGRRVRWERRAAPDRSRRAFRRYLDVIFTYAGTASLARELPRVPPDATTGIRPGDVLIQGGFPGHAVLVADCATRDGAAQILLVQSYMPAQQIHVLRAPAGGVWHAWPARGPLRTAEWTFDIGQLHRFTDPD